MTKVKSKKRFMHFPISIALGFSLFLAILFYLIFSLGHYSLSDQKKYYKLIHGEEDIPKTYLSRQHREFLQKDMILNEKGQRLQFRLMSTDADLVFDRYEGRTEIVEHMNHVICYMQEDLFFLTTDQKEAVLEKDGRYLLKGADPLISSSWLALKPQPLQKVLLLEADKASYYYKNDLFVAENVKISRYIAPSHSIEQALHQRTLLSLGFAKRVEFFLSGKGLKLKADHFKAKYYGAEGKL